MCRGRDSRSWVRERGGPGVPRAVRGVLSSPGSTTGCRCLPVSLAPPMMLLIARAATSRLSIGLGGVVRVMQVKDQATSPPGGGIGSRPSRPLRVAKFGLSPPVISANTQRIWRVAFAQAKFT